MNYAWGLEVIMLWFWFVFDEMTVEVRSDAPEWAKRAASCEAATRGWRVHEVVVA